MCRVSTFSTVEEEKVGKWAARPSWASRPRRRGRGQGLPPLLEFSFLHILFFVENREREKRESGVLGVNIFGEILLSAKIRTQVHQVISWKDLHLGLEDKNFGEKVK